jgi:hypothetical protein
MINSLKELKKKREPEEEVVMPRKVFENVFLAMNEEEKEKYAKHSLSGIYDKRSNTILMGEDAFKAIEEFQIEMIEKYGKAYDIIS